jgi:hypothetical protein
MNKHKRFTYANVVATLALVFAMSGGALAASKYLITSTKQISPKVVTALKGKAGAKGPAGSAGPAGPQGPAGTPGTPGAAGSAVAYAYIEGSKPPVTLSASKNVSAVTEITGSPGAYCLTVTVPFQNVAGITDLLGGGNGVTVSADTLVVPIEVASKVCPQGTSVIVETGNEKEGKAANFWVSFN